MNKRKIYIALHFLTWIFLAFIPFFIFDNPAWKEINYGLRWFTNTFLNAGIFYLYYGFVNPQYLKQQKLIKYLVISFIIISAYSLLRSLISITLLPDFSNAPQKSFTDAFISSLFLSTFFAGLAIFLNFTENWFLVQQLQQKIEKERLESELKMLRHQVNPHFLFNTLNNIHTLVYKKSDKAADAVLKLSGLMRYMLYESEGDVVLLGKEIEYITSFVELQKLRLTNPDQVQLIIEGNPDGKTIAPLLLMPFIENAFKYFSNTGESFLNIKIGILNNVIHFHCINSYRKDSASVANSGIGLSNVNKRLLLQYHDKHMLAINKNESTFEVNLTLTN